MPVAKFSPEPILLENIDQRDLPVWDLLTFGGLALVWFLGVGVSLPSAWRSLSPLSVSWQSAGFWSTMILSVVIALVSASYIYVHRIAAISADISEDQVNLMLANGKSILVTASELFDAPRKRLWIRSSPLFGNDAKVYLLRIGTMTFVTSERAIRSIEGRSK